MCAIQIVDSLPYDQWMKFVDDHPDGNIFHTPYMMDVFKRAINTIQNYMLLSMNEVERFFPTFVRTNFSFWRTCK